MFLVNAPVVAIALAAGLWFVPESRDPSPSPFDLPGNVLSIAMISAFVFAVIEARERGWTDTFVLATLAGAALLAAVFALWERRSRHPLFDFAYLRNPRFSVGATAIGIAFFALFGFIFGATQYLQFVKGFSPLEAGAAILPAAVGMMIGAGSSHRLVARFGTRTAVVWGMGLLTLAFALMLLLEPDTPYIFFGGFVLLTAYAMGTIMAPSTDAVMGAVPEAKAGVAMNDVSRQTGGALGVAIVGSTFASVYRTRVEEGLAGLPPAAAEAAGESLGEAVRVVASLPADAGARLLASAGQAFTDALGVGTVAAACVVFAGALVVLRLMPARHLPRAAPGGSAGGV